LLPAAFAAAVACLLLLLLRVDFVLLLLNLVGIKKLTPGNLVCPSMIIT
jgi:hypothetical protein